MALNTETGIDPSVDRFVIRSISTNSVINFNAIWPRTDGGAIQGGNLDLQYYKRVAGNPPDIDHRYELQTADVFTLTTPAPAEGLPVGTFGTTYTPVKRELNDLLAQIESAFQEQVRLQFPDTQNPSTLIMAAKVLAKKQSGAVLTVDEQSLLDSVTSVGDKVTQLAERRAELMTAAENDQDYDLTAWPVLS